MPQAPSKALLGILSRIKSKRPRTVIQHILQHGHVTTEELKSKYGYNHPPRAARDVREAGIPLQTFKVKGSDGRSIAAYRFGNLDKIESHKLEGRKVFSKTFSETLYEHSSGKCGICCSQYVRRFLQIDHRVPYQVAGELVSGENSPQAFMLLCGSCQRAKSWTCEQCLNWKENKYFQTCKECYWGSPESYTHVALSPIRRLELVWQGQDVSVYDRLSSQAKESSVDIHELAHKLIRDSLGS